MNGERERSADVSGHRASAARRPRLAARAVAALLLATLGLSGCVAGGLVRLGTWERDPSPFWVVMREGEGCTVVFDTVLMRDHRLESWVIPDSPIRWQCSSPVSWKPGQTAASVTFRYSPRETDVLPGKRSRTEQFLVRKTVFFGSVSEPELFVTLFGLRMGESGFCMVRVGVDRARFVYNAGANKNVHVIVGEGSRQCSGPG